VSLCLCAFVFIIIVNTKTQRHEGTKFFFIPEICNQNYISVVLCVFSDILCVISNTELHGEDTEKHRVVKILADFR
jgi:hypothetical protein